MNKKLALTSLIIISSLLISTGTSIYVDSLIQQSTYKNSYESTSNEVKISFLNKTTYDLRIQTKILVEGNKTFYADIPSFFIANLTDENNSQLAGKSLKLYRQIRNSFYEIGSASTDLQGMANFSLMFSNLPDGTYIFKVVFEGDFNYAPSEAFSKSQVIQDAPHGELQNVVITDGYIQIDYRAWTTGVWIIPYLWWKHDDLGWVQLYIFRTTDPDTHPLGLGPPHVSPGILYYKITEYSALVGKKNFMDSVYLPRNQWNQQGGDLDVDDWVGVYLYVWDDDSFDGDWFDNPSEKIINYYYYKVADDDSNPPNVLGSTSDGILIDSPVINNYEISIIAQDYSGWSGKIQYYYQNATFTSPTFTRSLGNTSSNYQTTLKASIPRSEFSQYIGTTIYYRYQLYDLDNDSGGNYYDNFLGWIPSDSIKTPLSNWIEAAGILGEFGASLDFKLVYTNFTGLNPYTNEQFALVITAANPLATPLWLGSFSILSNDSRIGYISDVFNQNLNPNQIVTKTIYSPDFKFFESDLGANEKIGLKFTLNLNYMIDSTPDIISEEIEFAVEKPPLPILTFKSFSGYKESTDPRLYLYQYKDGSGNKNIINCKISLYNPSRVTVKIFEQLLPSHAILGDSLLGSTQFNKLRILQNTLNTTIEPFHNKTLEFSLRVEDIRIHPSASTQAFASFILDLIGVFIEAFTKKGALIFDMIQDPITWYFLINPAYWDAWREYNFSVSTTSLQYYIDNSFQTVRSDYNRPIPVPERGKTLVLMPTGDQFAHLEQAIAADIAADVATWIAEILLMGSPDPYTKLAAGISFVIEGLLLVDKWCMLESANNWDPEDPNYDEIFEPTYRNISIPKNENLSISSLVDDAINITNGIVGDSEALQISINRKNTALLYENYTIAKMQTEAIEYYAMKMAENMDKLGDFEIRLFNEIKRINKSQEVPGGFGCLTEGNISAAKSEIAAKGLPSEEVAILSIFNFTQSMIENEKNSVIQRDEEFLTNISKISVQIKDTSDTLVNYYEKLGNKAFKEGIEISTTYLELTLIDVTEEHQAIVDNLKTEIEIAKQEERWNDVEVLSKELIEKAKEITILTGNMSLFTYIDYAQNESNNIKDIKPIDLTYNIKNRSIIPGTQEIIDIIILNKKSLGGIYNITIKGIPQSWYSMQEEIIHFEPMDFEKKVFLILNPPCDYSVVPGHYTIQIEILNQNGKVMVLEEIEIQILPFYNVALFPKVLDFHTTSGTVSRLFYNLSNLGNTPDIFKVIVDTFEFTVPKLALPTKLPLNWIQLSDTEFSLVPGQSQIFYLDITIPLDWKGFEPVTYPLNLTAYSLTDNTVKDKSSINFHVIATETSMNNYLLWEIDNFNAFIQNINLDSWRDPSENRRNAMSEKIESLKLSVLDKIYVESYDKLLHDIKPKLTGLKTNENEISWGNGIFQNPWIVNSTLKELFRELSNEILSHLATMLFLFF